MKNKFICPKCNRLADYHLDYDAYACSYCDLWLEEKCGDTNCEFCKNRPDKPSIQKDKNK